MNNRGKHYLIGGDLMINKVKKLSTQGENLGKLNLGVALLFLLAGSLQQFLTVHFGTIGKPDLGFKLLLTLYAAVFITNCFMHKIVNVLGERNSLVFSTVCYLCAGFASCQQSEFLLYLSFAVMGIGCALIWNTQNLVLIDNSEKDSLGKNAGLFNLYVWTGCFVGIMLFGLALKFYPFEQVVIIFTLMAASSIIFFGKIQNSPTASIKVENLRTVFQKKSYLLASTVSAKSYFIYGIAISFLPFITNKAYDDPFVVALISLVFFVSQALCSKPCGALIDKFGAPAISIIGAIAALSGFSMLIVSLHWSVLTMAALLLGISSAMLIPVTMVLPKVIAPANEQTAVIHLFMFAKYSGVLAAIALSTWGSIHDDLVSSILISILFLFILNQLKKSFLQREHVSVA